MNNLLSLNQILPYENYQSYNENNYNMLPKYSI